MSNPNCGNDIYNNAFNVYQELGSPTIVSVSWVSGWFYSNIGKLDNSLNLCVSGLSGNFIPTLGYEEWDIFKTLYKISYYDRQVNSSLGNAAALPWTMLQDDVSKIQQTSPNEFAKTWIMLRKSTIDELKDMIWKYQQNHAVIGVINMGVPWESAVPVPAYVNGPDRAGQSNYFG